MSDADALNYDDLGNLGPDGKPKHGPGYELGYKVGTSIAEAMAEILKAMGAEHLSQGTEFADKLDSRARANLRFSQVLTEAVKLSGKSERRELGRELRRFLDTTSQTDVEEVYAIWLNLKAFADTGQALKVAETYGLDPYTIGQALLTGYPMAKVESLAHLASVTGMDVYALVLQALTIDANGTKVHGQEG